MTPQWYCLVGGQQLGPLSDQQLRELAAEGRLQPGHYVRRSDLANWVLAERVQGLFGGLPGPGTAGPGSPGSSGSSGGSGEGSSPAAAPAAPRAPVATSPAAASLAGGTAAAPAAGRTAAPPPAREQGAAPGPGAIPAAPRGGQISGPATGPPLGPPVGSMTPHPGAAYPGGPPPHPAHPQVGYPAHPYYVASGPYLAGSPYGGHAAGGATVYPAALPVGQVVTPGAQETETRARTLLKRRRQSVVGPLIVGGMVVATIICFVAVLAWIGDQPRSDESAEKPRAQPGPRLLVDRSPRPASEVGPRTGQLAAAPVADRRRSPAAYRDATTSDFRLAGRALISIARVWRETLPPALVGLPERRVLAIELSVTNLGDGPLLAERWQAADEDRDLRLTDAGGVPLIRLPLDTLPDRWSQALPEMMPGDQQRQVLVFEAPDEDPASLRLTLGLGPLQAVGEARFLIPQAMWSGAVVEATAEGREGVVEPLEEAAGPGQVSAPMAAGDRQGDPEQATGESGAGKSVVEPVKPTRDDARAAFDKLQRSIQRGADAK